MPAEEFQRAIRGQFGVNLVGSLEDLFGLVLEQPHFSFVFSGFLVELARYFSVLTQVNCGLVLPEQIDGDPSFLLLISFWPEPNKIDALFLR